MPNAPPPWFCSQECRDKSKAGKSHDHIQAYSQTLGYMGLVDMVNRDIIREGDGEALDSEWRLAMPELWNKNHKKYVILGHNILTGRLIYFTLSQVINKMIQF